MKIFSDSDFKHNFHTHTFRCKHAKGDVADYCAKAIELGMETLGMSDHSALPDNRWQHVRMPYAQLDDYADAIDQARIDYPQLDIRKGMECEYVPKLHSFYVDELLGERQFDYLIGAAHFFTDTNGNWSGTYGGTNSPKALADFARYTVKMIETGLFDFIAHPDLFGNCYPNWDADTAACSRDIAAAAAEFGVGLEINALGLRKQAHKKNHPFPLYPWEPFWDVVAEAGAPVLINSDAHRPEDLQGQAGAAMNLAASKGLKPMGPGLIGQRQVG